MNVVQKMEALADEWHCGVERKGKGHVPYIAHPRAVVAQLKAWGMTEEADPVPLAVAWGHDLVEDTRVPAISILNAAGEHGIKVFEGILYLTFSRPEYPSAKGHDDAERLYMERLAREAPPEILMVKLADRICNTRDFMKAPPKDEPTKPARYLHEADPILAAVSRVPSAFAAAVKATIEELKRQVGYADWPRKEEPQ
ncbi:MAG: bifunctional (p)ppGpp synthetase/guanosine-3',5'-bis(diphosphate) 3'-pyrophosphohydrolase [Kiritimatiellae bacterium]|nr:bifunctional (p)ppGpp synthetase/guanosine-3',5'-bis(diphosphate) 3'-pyrophosphohydrolase [Kiritimatiellia bacterium]